ncbi:MAG TPA: TraB/GumN family protein [Steroidobacteraceae bacterium]|nr:TraB/GumN family protein [Steroidobacteraceae bacterium]
MQRRRTLRVSAGTAAALLAVAGLWPGIARPAQELLDEVLVTGEQPGPAMWKVRRGDHTLWIIGTLTPLPAQMSWRSKQVEEVIARSGEILGRYEGRAKIKGGNFAALRFLPAIMRLRFNADGRTLREVLPPDVYARWSAAHRRFFGHDPDPKERARPFYAADLLFDQALEKSGLSEKEVVWPKVDDLARRHKVRIRQLKIELPVDDPRGLIRDFAAVSPGKETACLVATLDRIDRDLPNMRRRAQAWAVGDIETLRTLPVVNQQQTCIEALLERPKLRDLADQARAKVEADRPGIISYMLLAHATSFTAAPLDELLRPDGLLARLRAAGYTVEEPQ